MRTKSRYEFTGTVIVIRAVEDSIRSTRKYTEGVNNKPQKQYPIQGGDFPSKVFCKYYEVYPTVDVSWDMPVGVAVDWLWHDVPCIDVVFTYDYRSNKASVLVKNGPAALDELKNAIPGFKTALAATIGVEPGNVDGTSKSEVNEADNDNVPLVRTVNRVG